MAEGILFFSISNIEHKHRYIPLQLSRVVIYNDYKGNNYQLFGSINKLKSKKYISKIRSKNSRNRGKIDITNIHT